MNSSHRTLMSGVRKRMLATALLMLASVLVRQAEAQSTFGGNPQHTGIFSAPAQNMNAVHWTASIDLNPTGGAAHYGSPLISAANNIFVPVKTGATDGFEVNVFDATNGTQLYSLSTDYLLPAHDWIPTYQPVLANGPHGTRLYYPGAGGTVYYIEKVDSASHSAPVQRVFYTTLANYQSNASGFNSTVFINTPLTADRLGNVFFGFRVDGTAPAPLNTTQSGFARITPNGVATYVLAGTAANDSNIGHDSHNSAPALSNDQKTLYVAVKSPSSAIYGYLLGLDTNTLATKYKALLKDPRNQNANDARILDDSTASPMVAPDNDIYFGIFGNPGNGSRGFLLHFSGDLKIEKTPGGFGWDNTVAIVPASMAPGYKGSSSYLLFSKYNNYANAGGDSGDGVNRIALLDPNATQVDAHPTSNGMLIMREVQTAIGPTADAGNRSASLPLAVREWCINTPAVNPATHSVFMPSEDGSIYRWNLVTNSLDQFVHLNPGIGLPYVPTLIGPDGQVYTLNGGTMSAIGSLSGVGIELTSSSPDVRTTVVGQPLTFKIAVANTGTGATRPTGTVTLTDTTYAVNSPGNLTTSTITLASKLPLDSNGQATFTTSALRADRHFITVNYSGDGNFSAGSASLIQFVHTSRTMLTLISTPNPSNIDQAVTFTATVVATTSGTGIPTGQVTFQEGNTVLAQIPVNGRGVASFRTARLTTGSHTVTATYASDTLFAAGYRSTVQTVKVLNATSTSVKSAPNPSVFGQSVTFTATTTSTSGTPAGTVTFTEEGVVLASNVPVDASGHASFQTKDLMVGSHTITATFTGSAKWASSAGVAMPQVVKQAATTTAVSSSVNPSKQGQSVTFTATVTVTAPGSGLPNGTVTFKEGTTVLGSAPLSSNHARFTTSTLSTGTHKITAEYTGSSNFLASTSTVFVQTVK